MAHIIVYSQLKIWPPTLEKLGGGGGGFSSLASQPP